MQAHDQASMHLLVLPAVQPWMRHVTHQMTTHVSVRKDDNAIIEPCALRCDQTVLHRCVL